MDESQQRLVTEHLGLVRAVARQRFATVGRRSAADYEDLVAAGEEALCAAAVAWDGRSPFPLFASVRVRQRMLDELRRLHGRPGTGRADVRLVGLDEATPARAADDPALVVERREELRRRWQAEPKRLPRRPLSAREREVLELAAAGLSGVETAAELGVGFETVRSHRKHLLAKLGARSIAHAVYLSRNELPSWLGEAAARDPGLPRRRIHA